MSQQLPKLLTLNMTFNGRWFGVSCTCTMSMSVFVVLSMVVVVVVMVVVMVVMVVGLGGRGGSGYAPLSWVTVLVRVVVVAVVVSVVLVVAVVVAGLPLAAMRVVGLGGITTNSRVVAGMHRVVTTVSLGAGVVMRAVVVSYVVVPCVVLVVWVRWSSLEVPH